MRLSKRADAIGHSPIRRFNAYAIEIEAAITPKTKAICCISPGNPTGRVLTLEDMRHMKN